MKTCAGGRWNWWSDLLISNARRLEKCLLKTLEGERPSCCFLCPLVLNEFPWNNSSAAEVSCAPRWLVLCALWTENENANAWFMCEASTATLPGWTAQCTCGTETPSPQDSVLLILTPLLYWGGSSCSSWKGKHPVCCFSDAWEQGGKTPCAQLLTNNQEAAFLVMGVPESCWTGNPGWWQKQPL